LKFLSDISFCCQVGKYFHDLINYILLTHLGDHFLRKAFATDRSVCSRGFRGVCSLYRNLLLDISEENRLVAIEGVMNFVVFGFQVADDLATLARVDLMELLRSVFPSCIVNFVYRFILRFLCLH
jgi:hypothetical protein